MFFKRGQMLIPIYQTPYYIVFKPITRQLKTGACLVSRNHFCAGCVCVCVSAPEGTNNYSCEMKL